MSKIVRNIPDGLEASYADIKLDTISDLVNLTGTPPEIVWVSGYHTKGDGAYGSHIFEWDETSTETHNGVTVVKVDAIDTGRYKLKIDNFINTKMLGVIGDGTAEDNTRLINASKSIIDYNFPIETSEIFPINFDRKSVNYVENYDFIKGPSHSDLLIEVKKNSLGGTSDVINRMFCYTEIDLNGGQVDFSIDISTDLTDELSINWIANSNSLYETHYNEFALTDNGGGNYTASWTPSSTSSKFVGFRVGITPNVPNDTTLVPKEVRVINARVTQGGIDLMNFQTMDVFSNVEKCNDINFTKIGNITVAMDYYEHGGYRQTVYANTSGSVENTGTPDSPYDFETGRRKINAGSVKTLILEEGEYDAINPRPRILFNNPETVICINGVANIKTTKTISASDAVAYNAIYKMSYDNQNHYISNEVTSGYSAATMAISSNDYAYEKLSSITDVEAKAGSYYWDSGSQEFYINFVDGTPVDIEVHETEKNLYVKDKDCLSMKNIHFSGGRIGTVQIENVKNFVLDNVKITCGNGINNQFEIKNSWGYLENCTGNAAQNDGFGIDGVGHQTFNNCVAIGNLDDGASHHGESSGLFYKGEYSNNGKAGIIPAFGASAVCYRVVAKDNISGRSPRLVNNPDYGDVYGGFIGLGAKMYCKYCISDNNHYGYAIANYKMNVRSATSTNETTYATFYNAILEIEPSSSLSIKSDNAINVKFTK